MIPVGLPDGHIWFRITRPHYHDPFDTTFAQQTGGRWNPPESWPTLYLNSSLATVHAQVRHMFAGRGVGVDDLDDDAPINLAAAQLPAGQQALDAVSTNGIAAIALPPEYPLDVAGEPITHDVTQPIGATVHAAGLDGVLWRSATGVDSELAWFPGPTAAALPSWTPPAKPFGAWRHAVTFADIA